MSMEKRKLNETPTEDLIVLLSIIPVGLTLWWLKKMAGKAFGYAAKKLGLDAYWPSEKSQKVANVLSNDKAFVKDMAKIISDEGGVDEFVKKTKVKGEIDPYSIMTTGYQSWKKENNKIPSNAVDIVEKILKTPSFKQVVKKHDLDKNDIQTLGNGFLIGISSPDFKSTAQKMVDDTIKKAKVRESSTKLKNLMPKQ